jgi:hypothetical protein
MALQRTPKAAPLSLAFYNMEKTTLEFIRRFIRCFKDLHATEDIISFMIRGHLHCESVLTALLLKAIQRPDALDVDRLDFQAKLNLCNAFGLIPSYLVPGLAKLGQFRNRLAHRLEYTLSEQDQTDFINTIRSTGGPHTEYYLSKRTHFPNGLRRCIVGLLMDLSINLADTFEQKKDMLINLALAMQKISGMDFDEFFVFVKKELQ